MSGIDIFVCGAREDCYRCNMRSVARCQAPGCGRPLCGEHRRKESGEDRCAEHAPSKTTANMPRPPGRPR